MDIGRKTPIKAVGYFDRCTDGNVQLHKRLYRIQCHENGLSVNGYFVQVFTLPYTLIKSIDHLTRNEVGAWQQWERQYYLRITYLKQSTGRHEVLVFKCTRPFQAIYDYWVRAVVPWKQ